MKLLRILAAGACLLFGLAGTARAETPTPEADRTLAGDAACTRCHDQGETKPVLSIYQTAHGVKADGRTPGCQSCHGASLQHVTNEAGTDPRPPVDISFIAGGATSNDTQVQTCISCHRGGQRGHWDGSQHQSAGLACVACHMVHTKQDRVLTRQTQPEVCFACHKSERAQIHKISTHPLAAGKMACADCHNPHGSTGVSLMRKGSVNETCTSCHAEKRGPFLWEHEPVSEACTNCHTPHGSNISPLLKVRTPWLCQACHSGDHGAEVNSGSNLRNGVRTTVNGLQPPAGAPPRAQLNARNCQGCHFQTHGSNHPAGAKLTR
jgi:DmsE family decaheme c-type cytochrome